MSYRVLTDYRAGMPRTPKDVKPYRLIACHWTAGGAGYNGAIGTIGYMVSTASQRNASYHELWAYDESSDLFSVIRIVPVSHCAHSLNPQQPPGPYTPDAWVREALGGNWWDPNQGVYAVSIAGGATECARYAGNLKFIAHAKRRIGEIRSEIPGLVGLAEHSRFQNNKADWGPALTPKLGGHQFMTTIPDAATEDPMPKLTTRITGQQFRVPAGTQFRKAPTFGTAPYYTSPSAMSVQPFGVVNGDAYKTSATETGRGWYVYVASDLSYGYVPAVNGELVAIEQPSDCAAAVKAATDPLYERIDNLKAISADSNKRIQNG